MAEGTTMTIFSTNYYGEAVPYRTVANSIGHCLKEAISMGINRLLTGNIVSNCQQL
jgi:hypothetical protein